MILLLVSVATFAGGEPASAPAPPPPVEIVSAVEIRAAPEAPIHDGQPQAPRGQTAAHATVIPNDGFGFPVETGPAEIRRLGEPYDVRDLAELCVPKPWLCS